jgi:hypothetical protein
VAYTWNEISKWAKGHGYKVSKKDGLFTWNNQNNPEKGGQENNFEDLIKRVYNEISDYKFVQHQKDYTPVEK